MSHEGYLTSGRVTHETGSVDDISGVAPESQHEAVTQLCSVPAISEAFVLATCNRVEAYVVSETVADGRAAIEEFFAPAAGSAVSTADHESSLEHLLRVAAGLESVVLGEDQILGQVRTAYEDATGAGGIGPLLETAVTKAIHVGERARTETAINEGVVSLGSAAVRRADDELSLTECSALVIGAGEMGRTVARSLADRNVEHVTVANRTASRARDVVDELSVPTSVSELTTLEGTIEDVDLVVAATGSDEPLVGPAMVPETPPLFVDLGQPRDVSPAVSAPLLDLDDLESVTAATREQRAAAAAQVEDLIETELEQLRTYLKRTRADEVIAAMYESAERVKHRELETALTRLETAETDEDRREIVSAMADALVSQLLAPPTDSLRTAAEEDDWETIATALQLFDPDFAPDEITPRDGAGVSTGATEEE